MKILISGDLNPNNKLKPFFENGSIDMLLSRELRDIWFNSDIRIFNLEVPLVADNELMPIVKEGKNFAASIDSINGIIKLKPSLICLANNHIMDHGIAGLKKTVQTLKNNSINYTGIILNNEDSIQSYFSDKRIKIGVYNFAENEFNKVIKNNIGANTFDYINTFNNINEMSKQCDYLVVIFHGGKEYYRYPTPQIQKICRKIIDSGADFITLQHSHCIGSKEVYNGKTIVYGQGNFLFNYDNKMNDPFWNNGLMIELNIDDNLNEKIVYHPYLTTNTGIKLANNNDGKQIITEFLNRSNEIKNQNFIIESYEKFAQVKTQEYLYLLSPFPRIIKRIDKKVLKGKLLKFYFNDKRITNLLNILRCESHNELLVEGLSIQLHGKSSFNELI